MLLKRIGFFFFQTDASMGLQLHVLIAVSCKVEHHDFGMASFDRTVRNTKKCEGFFQLKDIL